MSKEERDQFLERIKNEYKPLKVVSETKASVVVKMTRAQYDKYSAEIAKWHRDKEIRETFRATHTRKTWEDDYGSLHSCWVNNETKKEIPDHQVPFMDAFRKTIDVRLKDILLNFRYLMPRFDME